MTMTHVSGFGSGSGMYNSGIGNHPLTGQRLIDYLSTRNRIPYYYKDVVNMARNHAPFLYQMNLMKKLPVHKGCVNTICWNKTGEYILSGSDDRNLCITKPTDMFDNSKDYTVRLKLPTRHLGNIFSAQFVPYRDDSLLVSCSSEGPVIVHDVNSENPSEGMLSFNCHSATIYEVATLPHEDNIFLSCSEDKTLRLYDMRCHRSCARAGTCPHPALIRNSHAMTTLSVHPINTNLLLVGRADGVGLVYDRRKLPDPREFSREGAHAEYLANDGKMPKNSRFKYVHPLEGVVSQFVVPDMNERCRFTSLCFSANGRQVLASYSQEYIYLFNYNNDTDFELIQTLPKKPEKTKQDSSSSSNDEDNNTNSDSNNDEDSPQNNNNNNNTRSSPQSRTNNNTYSQSINSPRIRVPGDWSDTGQNSTPRGDDYGGNSRSRNILQRLTEAALGISRREFTDAPVTELIMGPLRLNRESSDERNQNDDNNLHDDNEENEEVADSEDEMIGDLTEISDTIRFNVEVKDRHSQDDDHDDDDDDDEEEEEEEDDMDTDNNDDTVVEGSSSSSKKTRGRISSKTKAKFKKSFAGLKDRLNRIPKYKPRVRYQGHRNSRTSIKESIFWGDNYIMSGSDCGRIMVWEKDTAKLVMAFPADDRVVNCFAPNPTNYSLASSGIDYDIKLWSTQYLIEHPLIVGDKEMDSIVENNEKMLEQAKNTITVPPHLFFRVLASFAQNNAVYGHQ